MMADGTQNNCRSDGNIVNQMKRESADSQNLIADFPKRADNRSGFTAQS